MCVCAAILSVDCYAVCVCLTAAMGLLVTSSKQPVKQDELRSAVEHLESDEFLKVVKRDGRDFTLRVIAPSL